ncbi:MAG: PEGA domain-containing protein [Bacteroidetes bacterium]|jgi:hypothetical protein|nr:PEGA domain-containing protein [Bacteroidota bacterium]
MMNSISRLVTTAYFFLTCFPAFAQFHYDISTVPDSAHVFINGKEECRTPCRIEFLWSDYKDSKMHITVNSEGYETWRDTIALKPYQLNLDRTVDLTEKPTQIEVDSNSALIAYDRLSANFADGKTIGSYKDDDGEVIEEIKWDGGVKLGSTGFEELFYEVLTNNGFNTPLKQAAELFSNRSEERKKYPRYLIGAKLLEYDVQLQQEKLNILKKDDVLGRTTMKLRWGILDNTTDKVTPVQYD